MEKRETPWWVIITCAFPAVVIGTALFTATWEVLLIFAVVAGPSCVSLGYVLYLHDELAHELSDALLRANEALKPAPSPMPATPQPPPAQRAERDEVLLGVMENVTSQAVTKTAPVAASEPATKPAPVMTIPDVPPVQKEEPRKIQPAPSTDLVGAKLIPHTGNPPKDKSFHFVRPERAAIVKALRHSNYDVAVTNGSDITEEALLDMAHEERRVLVSTNVDFEILSAQGRKHSGILIIPRDAKAETILAACRAVWSKGRKDEGGIA